MIYILTLCALITLALDYRFIQSLSVSERARERWLYLLIAINLLPTMLTAPMYLFSTDNMASLEEANRWGTFLYLVLGIARQPFCIAYIISRNGWLRAAGATISLCAATIFIHGMAVTRTDYLINRFTISSERVPQSFDGYRIVQFSDLHIATLVNPEKEIAEIVEQCNSLKPDIVAFCGDLVDIRYGEVTPRITDRLKQLKATDGVFSIIGNHDTGVYVRDSIRLKPKENLRRVIASQEEMGWRVLDNQTHYISRGCDSISVTGISFDQSLHEERHSSSPEGINLDSIYHSLPAEKFNITLSHIPQLWENIRELHPTDLTLSGHVHAMQIAVKVGQWRLSPSMLLYNRWSGLYQEQGQYLYINDGIGYGLFPMRIGARPEITLFELKCDKKPLK